VIDWIGLKVSTKSHLIIT